MLYQSFKLVDGNTGLTDTEDWDGVHFIFFEIIFWGQMSQMSLPLKKTFPLEKDKEYPARSVNNLASVKV